MMGQQFVLFLDAVSVQFFDGIADFFVEILLFPG
jgi:hypothetical protein